MWTFLWMCVFIDGVLWWLSEQGRQKPSSQLWFLLSPFPVHLNKMATTIRRCIHCAMIAGRERDETSSAWIVLNISAMQDKWIKKKRNGTLLVCVLTCLLSNFLFNVIVFSWWRWSNIAKACLVESEHSLSRMKKPARNRIDVRSVGRGLRTWLYTYFGAQHDAIREYVTATNQILAGTCVVHRNFFILSFSPYDVVRFCPCYFMGSFFDSLLETRLPLLSTRCPAELPIKHPHCWVCSLLQLVAEITI